MISVNCKNCGKKFEAQRKSAKFCSDLCRVKFAQKLAKQTGTKIAAEVTTIETKKEEKKKPIVQDEDGQTKPMKVHAPYRSEAILKKLGWTK